MRATTNLEYGKVIFRPTSTSDLKFVLESERHPDNSAYIRCWSAQQHLEAIKDPNVGHFIVEEVANQTRVGHVILVGLQDPDLCLEFRRLVIVEKRHGYARHAVRLVKQYAFETLGFHRLWLDVTTRNRHAYKLYKSEGFSKEGVHREAVRQGDEFISVRVMSILRAEYFQRHYHRHTRLLTDAPGDFEPGRIIMY